ncbi:uncharacterized protein LOC131144247 isoform X1 [Malania oleifera]|uniref:uncharacterized protein LOC131144247 isoform X1 n=1 Tax=Malania oleifera TaxID=397392 RepID=UPI0025AE6E8C|nr:uncharacterized protein LOC131144247 isoform X1 [Malania oleifera]
MWCFASNAIANMGLNKNSSKRSRASSEVLDDEICSNISREEGLECPICCESFNIVENVPYVLWCGHTLCKNCVLGLQWAIVKLPTQKIQIPFLISCPWCHFLSPRLVYKGVLKFPRKNFFLLWLVESLNADRLKSFSSFYVDHQPASSLNSNLVCESQASNSSISRRVPCSPCPGHLGNDDDSSHITELPNVARHHFSLKESLNLFIDFAAKFPLVLILLLIVFCVLPASAAMLALYVLVTVLVALPSCLVLYFTYPILVWLVREITA